MSCSSKQIAISQTATKAMQGNHKCSGKCTCCMSANTYSLPLHSIYSLVKCSQSKASLSIYKYTPFAPTPPHINSLAFPFPALSSESVLAMEGKRGGKVLISFLLTVVVSQSLVTQANCRKLEKEFAEQKTYYSPDPHAVSPPFGTVSPRRRT